MRAEQMSVTTIITNIIIALFKHLVHGRAKLQTQLYLMPKPMKPKVKETPNLSTSLRFPWFNFFLSEIIFCFSHLTFSLLPLVKSAQEFSHGIFALVTSQKYSHLFYQRGKHSPCPNCCFWEEGSERVSALSWLSWWVIPEQ